MPATLSEKLSFKAMILAAGRGERMRPLTDAVPKPLLRAGGRALIEYHLENLKRAGFCEIVINHAHLGDSIETALGNGRRYGLDICYSREQVALETAGGIALALPLLRGELGRGGDTPPFLVINADIYCEMDFSLLVPALWNMRLSRDLAYLVLVDNPVHHPKGDFSLDSGRVALSGKNRLTFSGIGIYKPELFSDIIPGATAKLAPLLTEAIAAGRVGGEHYRGAWMDIGTPERLRQLDYRLAGAGAHAEE
jgi:MurNAc alpha-1-phosphate uridylyltransferase